jgi:hypothetical protein
MASISQSKGLSISVSIVQHCVARPHTQAKLYHLALCFEEPILAEYGISGLRLARRNMQILYSDLERIVLFKGKYPRMVYHEHALRTRKGLL